MINKSDQLKNANTSEEKTTQSEMRIWRSFESKHQKDETGVAPQVENREFPQAVQDLMDRGAALQLNRRKFLTLMGASLSMAGTSCMREPIEKIVPYVERPYNYTPGKDVYYATGYISSEGAQPFLMKTREGKPLKVEAYNEHPVFKGALGADTVATIWDLYDPDRVQSPLTRKGSERGVPGDFEQTEWSGAEAQLQASLATDSVAVLARPSFSPSEQKLRSSFNKGDRRVVVYDPLGNQAEALAGESASYGSSVIPQYHIERADLIFSLEADFLGTWLSPSFFTTRFSERRHPDQRRMLRLISAESMMSITGANADQRLPIRAGSQGTLALGLAHLLLPRSNYANDAEIKKAVKDYTPSVVSEVTGLKVSEIEALADELAQYKGRSLVLSGGASARKLAEGQAQILANLLNSLLENDGRTITTRAPFKAQNDLSSSRKLSQLISDMKGGKIRTLIVDRCNPVFDLPPESGIIEALKNVDKVIYMGTHLNETAVRSDLVLASSHQYESWADGYSYGVYTIAQPTLSPLFDTKMPGELWLKALQFIGDDFGADYLAFIQQTAQSYFSKAGISFKELLAQGYATVDKPQQKASARQFSARAIQRANVQAPTTKQSGYRLNLYQNVQVGDGSGANIAFRQELPDPVTKITWDNYIAISPADAKAKGWETGDILRVKRGKNKEVDLPVFVQPGLLQGSAAVALGYGHEHFGKVAEGVGKNAWQLARYSGGVVEYSGLPVTLTKVDSDFTLATTQRHHELGQERGLVRQTSLQEYKEAKRKNKPLYEEHLPHGGTPDNKVAKGLYEPYEYPGQRWNMTVDLTKCTGCSACVVACYSENNIPAVGKDEVAVGREMSWLRIDRYYAYSSDEAEKNDPNMERPEVLFQPVMCQHCENAPCENVCPVGATAHSEDGLNYMSYNRCIGTRYCANNCPYKVRRFNWFENWNDKLRDPEQLALNPEVTVRSQGVIEKCSFCQQRISEARQEAKLEGKEEVPDGRIQTACQNACPADAITFGDINDEDSAVSREAADKRAYKILLQTNVEPQVSYLMKVKNQA